MVALEGESRTEGSLFGFALLTTLAVLSWIVWIGWAHDGLLCAPAGDAGLCLAFVLSVSGARLGLSLAAWVISILWTSMWTGVSPLWLYLTGWPAWVMLSWSGLTEPRRETMWSSVLAAAALVSLMRIGVKLTYSVLPSSLEFPTLTGWTLAGSLWAEVLSNTVFVLVFLLVFRVWRPRC